MLDVPAKPPTSLPAPPDLPVLGTKANIDLTKGSHYASRIQGVTKNAYNKRDVRESEGNGDKLSEVQEFNAPEINSAFVGFNIEMYFELSDIEGGQHSNWSNGVVTEIVNEKNKSVQENGTSHVCQR